MIRLAARTFADRWPLFVGTVSAVTLGVAIVHAGMTIILGVEGAAPTGLAPEQAAAFRQSASAASTLTGMTVVLGGFLTIFVVASTLGFAVDQRRHDLAALRLGGVTAGQVRRLLLAEAMLAALVGAAAGAVLGVALAQVQRAILSGLGAFPPALAIPVRPELLALDIVVAVGVCLVGGWGVARRATRIAPLAALRRGADERRAMTPGRWIGTAVFTALTVTQIFFAASAGGVLIPLLLGLGTVLTGSAAMSGMAPLVVPVLARALGALTGRSPVAGLAAANLRDAVRRTASCAAPMIVLVGLVMGLQGILDTQTRAAGTEADRLLRADLVATGAPVDADAVASIPGIAVASVQTRVPLTVRLGRDGIRTDSPGTVVAVDPVAFRATNAQQPARGDVSDFDARGIVFGPGLDSTMLADRYDTIEVLIDDRPVRLGEAARMGETLAGEDGFYLDRSIVPARLLDGPTTVVVQLLPGADAAAVGRALRAAGAADVRRPGEITPAENAAADAENRGVMAAIVGLGSGYALISVLSTLAISVGQRRGELATLRLAGLTRRQIVGAMVGEALGAIAIGLVLGAVAAVLGLVGLWLATARVYGSPVIAIPWSLLAAITGLTALLTALTAVLAARSALRIPAIRALGTGE